LTIGNAGVLMKEWGVSADLSLDNLRLGVRTLIRSMPELDSAQKEDSLIQQLTFFDLTDISTTTEMEWSPRD
jgi:hypothetical protein